MTQEAIYREISCFFHSCRYNALSGRSNEADFSEKMLTFLEQLSRAYGEADSAVAFKEYLRVVKSTHRIGLVHQFLGPTAYLFVLGLLKRTHGVEHWDRVMNYTWQLIRQDELLEEEIEEEGILDDSTTQLPEPASLH